MVRGTTCITIALRVPCSAKKICKKSSPNEGPFYEPGKINISYDNIRISKDFLRKVSKDDIIQVFENSDPIELKDGFQEEDEPYQRISG